MDIQKDSPIECVDSKPNSKGWSLVIVFSLGGLIIGAFFELSSPFPDSASLLRTAILGAASVGVGASVFLWGIHPFRLKLFFPLIALTGLILFSTIEHHSRERALANYDLAREMLEEKQIYAGQSTADFLTICEPYNTERFGPFTLYEMRPGTGDKLSIVAKDDKLIVARTFCKCTGEHYAFVEGVTKPELDRVGIAWKDWRQFEPGTWGKWPFE